MNNYLEENSGLSVIVLLREIGKLICKANSTGVESSPTVAANIFLTNSSLQANPKLAVIFDYIPLLQIDNELVKRAEQITAGTSEVHYAPSERLQSIFTTIGGSRSVRYFDVGVTDLKTAVFARNSGFYATDSQYGYLWSVVKEQITEAGKTARSTSHFLHNLLDILKRNITSIPCDVDNLPDVSWCNPLIIGQIWV